MGQFFLAVRSTPRLGHKWNSWGNVLKCRRWAKTRCAESRFAALLTEGVVLIAPEHWCLLPAQGRGQRWPYYTWLLRPAPRLASLFTAPVSWNCATGRGASGWGVPRLVSDQSGSPAKSPAISSSCSSAARRSSRISSAIMSGGGRLAESSMLSSRSQKMSRLALSRLIRSS